MRRMTVLLLFLMLAIFPVATYAESSLTDLANSAASQSSDTTRSGSGSDAVAQTNEMLQGLSAVTDVSEQDETVKKMVTPLQSAVTIIVQALAYIITLGLSVRILCDLTYITLPFLRGLLGPGVQQGGPAGNAYGGGYGYDNGGYGSGGYGNGGYGNGGYGNGGYGRRNYGGRQNVGNQPGGVGGGFQLVSEAAVGAVQAGVSPLKTYAKDMLGILILTPILLVLVITGTLADLGFTIGSLVSSLIGQAGTLIGI